MHTSIDQDSTIKRAHLTFQITLGILMTEEDAKKVSKMMDTQITSLKKDREERDKQRQQQQQKKASILPLIEDGVAQVHPDGFNFILIDLCEGEYLVSEYGTMKNRRPKKGGTIGEMINDMALAQALRYSNV